MSVLQTINLGTAPTGSDGDAVRTAFIKDNANIAILNTQETLYSVALITAAQALTTAHIGKRVNINLSTAGTINLPAAATCALDQVTLLRNLGSTVVTLAIASGSGDTLSVSKLNPGETALFDTDGAHAWTCLMRGRSNTDNESVNGNSTVGGNETVGGTLTVTGASTLAALTVTGASTFAARPTFAANTPWDSGNLTPGNYAPLNGPAAFSTLSASGGLTAAGNSYLNAGLRVNNSIIEGALANNQGAYLVWNESGNTGATYLINNQGSGSGGFVFRTVNLANTTEVGRVTFTASGSVVAGGATTLTVTGGFGYLNNAGAGTSSNQTIGYGFYTGFGMMAAQYWATSDERIKSDIESIPEDFAVSFVETVNGYSFVKDGAPNRTYGYIAQEVGRGTGGVHMLNAVPREGLPGYTDGHGFTSPDNAVLTVDYDQVSAVQQVVLRNLLRRVAELEAKLVNHE